MSYNVYVSGQSYRTFADEQVEEAIQYFKDESAAVGQEYVTLEYMKEFQLPESK